MAIAHNVQMDTFFSQTKEPAFHACQVAQNAQIIFRVLHVQEITIITQVQLIIAQYVFQNAVHVQTTILVQQTAWKVIFILQEPPIHVQFVQQNVQNVLIQLDIVNNVHLVTILLQIRELAVNASLIVRLVRMEFLAQHVSHHSNILQELQIDVQL